MCEAIQRIQQERPLTADGDLLHYSAVASEALESASKAHVMDLGVHLCKHWTWKRQVNSGDGDEKILHGLPPLSILWSLAIG